MSLTNKDFFAQLREDDEYLNCFMTKEVYSSIELENRERIAVNQVRKKNRSFENDETHKQLLKNKLKADKELINYEFEVNNK